MSSDIALVVFDWDGTVMDSVGRIVSSMRSAAELSGLVVPTEHQVKQIIGLSLDPVFDILFPGINATQRQTVFEHYRDQYLSHDHPPTPLFEGAEQVMQELKQQGMLLAVATGKARKGLKRMFEETGLEPYFTTSRCADEAQSKPHPEMIISLLHELGIQPERALMVGDSLLDLTMAANAGIDSIGVTYGAHSEAVLRQAKPIALIDSPQQLLQHL